MFVVFDLFDFSVFDVLFLSFRLFLVKTRYSLFYNKNIKKYSLSRFVLKKKRKEYQQREKEKKKPKKKTERTEKHKSTDE